MLVFQRQRCHSVCSYLAFYNVTPANSVLNAAVMVSVLSPATLSFLLHVPQDASAPDVWQQLLERYAAPSAWPTAMRSLAQQLASSHPLVLVFICVIVAVVMLVLAVAWVW
jgi:hypothetical protein